MRGLPRIVFAPAPVGPHAVNRIVYVVLEEDEDVIWVWTYALGGTQVVSGYTIVPRLPVPLASDSLRIRPPAGRYGSPSEVPLPPPLKLDFDPLELLRDERQPRLHVPPGAR